MKTTTIIPLLLVLVCANAVTAQSVFNASGGSYSSNNFSYEWSMGELALVNEMTNNEGTYVLTNGFLQPFVKKETLPPPAVFKGNEFKVLNNPVKTSVNIQLLTSENGKLILSLYDDRGRIGYYTEMNVTAGGVLKAVSMMNFANGNYILKAEFIGAASKEKKSQSYKIVKIH